MIDPTKLYQKLYDSGQEWADKDAAANLLEETKKSVLAQCMTRFPGVSRAEAEQNGLASDVYQEHVRSMVTARQEANKARAQYDAIKIYVELVRTVESTRRAEMNLR